MALWETDIATFLDLSIRDEHEALFFVLSESDSLLGNFRCRGLINENTIKLESWFVFFVCQIRRSQLLACVFVHYPLPLLCRILTEQSIRTLYQNRSRNMDDQQDDPPPRWNRGNYPFFTKNVSDVLYGRQQPDQRRPKRDSLRAKQRTKRIWNAITKAYPADHIQRKTELCDALRRFETAAGEATRSREAALDHEANHEALNFDSQEMVRLCSDSVAKSIQHLRRLLSAIQALQRVDTTAEPINFMLNDYNGLVQPERNRIDDDVRALGYWVVSANRHAGHKATANRRERLQRDVYDAQRNPRLLSLPRRESQLAAGRLGRER